MLVCCGSREPVRAGAQQLSEGSAELADGTGRLASGSLQLASGTDELRASTQAASADRVFTGPAAWLLLILAVAAYALGPIVGKLLPEAARTE